jgi:hypothetical protein
MREANSQSPSQLVELVFALVGVFAHLARIDE